MFMALMEIYNFALNYVFGALMLKIASLGQYCTLNGVCIWAFFSFWDHKQIHIYAYILILHQTYKVMNLLLYP